jgi:hypothetical protein
MATEAHCPDGNCPSLGIEATPLERFADVSTEDGQLLVYDRNDEDAWIQSDLYYAREAVV